MTEETTSKTFDLIRDIALKAQNKCDEPIPGIIKAALDEIVGLARYKGMSGVSADRRELFGLPPEDT